MTILDAMADPALFSALARDARRLFGLPMAEGDATIFT